MIELIVCLSCGFFVASTVIFLIDKKRREKNKIPNDMTDLDHYWEIILKGTKHLNSIMRLFGKSKEGKIAKFKEKQSMINGKELKKLLKIFKENRDEIENRTGKRPEIDDMTKLFMQKILNVWLSEGKDIDDERFWNAVDYNKQFDYPVEYYERWCMPSREFLEYVKNDLKGIKADLNGFLEIYYPMIKAS